MKRLSLLFFLTGLFLTLCVMPNFAQAEDSTYYTREQLENQLREQMMEQYQQSQKAQEAINAAQKELDSLTNVAYTADEAYKIDKLKKQVYNGEISDDEYKKALKDLKKQKKDRIKALEKEIKNQQKIVDDFTKDYEKAKKQIDKTLEKQEKNVNKAAEKSEKLAAALKECESMAANPSTRQACADKAKKKYGLSDEEQALLDQHLAEEEEERKRKEQEDIQNYIDDKEEEAAEELPIPGVDQEEGKAGDATDQIGNEGNADGSTGIKGVCADAGSGDTKVFAQIACKVMMFLIDLRVIAYIISGFGMVAFAYAAVFNKINWKHFASIAIGLFLLAMIGPFVSYFTGDTTVEANLQYGNYLGGRYQGIEGTGNDVSDSDVPNTNVETKKKWGFSDLVGSVKSGINMARSAYNTYQTAKSAINTVKNNVDIIKNSIANSGGGLDGILGAIGNTAGALNNIGFAVSTGVGNTLAGIGNTANNFQDTFTDNAGRTENAQQRADGGSSNLVSQWLNSEQGGAGLTNTVSDLNNIINKGATVAGAATTVAHEGQNIGGGGTFGDILGGIMGAGQALVSGADMSQQLQQEKQLEQQRQQQMQQQQQQQQQAASQPLYNSLFDKPSSSTTQKSNSTSTSTSTTSTGNTSTGNTSTGNTRTNTSTGNTRTNTTQTNNTPMNNAPTNNTSTQTSAVIPENQRNLVTWTDSSGQTHYGKTTGDTFNVDNKGNGVYTTSNGTVTYNQDGSKYIKTNSGKEATINTDGSKVVKDTNTGVEVHLTADGKMWWVDADGKAQELDPNSNLGKQIQKL